MPLYEEHDEGEEFIVPVDDAEEVPRVPLGKDLRVARVSWVPGGGEGGAARRGRSGLRGQGGLGVALHKARLAWMELHERETDLEPRARRRRDGACPLLHRRRTGTPSVKKQGLGWAGS